MNDTKFRGRVLFKKITEDELGLSLTVRLYAPFFQSHIYHLIKIFREFFGTSSLDCFLYLIYHIYLQIFKILKHSRR